MSTIMLDGDSSVNSSSQALAAAGPASAPPAPPPPGAAAFQWTAGKVLSGGWRRRGLNQRCCWHRTVLNVLIGWAAAC